MCPVERARVRKLRRGYSEKEKRETEGQRNSKKKRDITFLIVTNGPCHAMGDMGFTVLTSKCAAAALKRALNRKITIDQARPTKRPIERGSPAEHPFDRRERRRRVPRRQVSVETDGVLEHIRHARDHLYVETTDSESLEAGSIREHAWVVRVRACMCVCEGGGGEEQGGI